MRVVLLRGNPLGSARRGVLVEGRRGVLVQHLVRVLLHLVLVRRVVLHLGSGLVVVLAGRGLARRRGRRPVDLFGGENNYHY